jgi:hypothetical protein
MIAVERMAHDRPVDGDPAAGPADILTWQTNDVIRGRHAPRQITGRVEKSRERFRRPDPDKLTDVMDAVGSNA